MKVGEKMRKTLLSEMEKQHISQKQLSSTIGVSVGVINKFLTQEKEIAFDIVWKIVRIVAPDKVVELMDMYCTEITKKNIKLGLEYYSLNRRFSQLYLLIEKAKHGSLELQEWAKIYSVFHEFQTSARMGENIDFLTRFFYRIDTPYKETKLLLYIFEMYTHYFRNDYKTLYTFLINLPSEVIEIENSFLRKCLSARIDELMCHMEMKHNNNIEGTRLYCRKILEHNIAENLNATANFFVGLSYIMDDFDKCITYFQKCYDYYEKIGRVEVMEDIQNNIEFAYVYWDKEKKFASDFYQSLFDVKQGRLDANALNAYKSTETTPYIFLIKGIALNDISYLTRSLIQFIKKEDTFRANLPAFELKNRGYDDLILQEAFRR
jgi:hypothetical protein